MRVLRVPVYAICGLHVKDEVARVTVKRDARCFDALEDLKYIALCIICFCFSLAVHGFDYNPLQPFLSRDLAEAWLWLVCISFRTSPCILSLQLLSKEGHAQLMMTKILKLKVPLRTTNFDTDPPALISSINAPELYV